MASDRYSAVGKRKSSIARVFLNSGKGKIIVNKRDFETYFGRVYQRKLVEQPLSLVDQMGKFDVMVNVRGGGLTGQACAVRHGISKILAQMSDEFKPVLKRAGLLTRDARVKERKKYGLRGARAAFQFSKP